MLNPIDADCDIVGFSGPYDGTAHGASGTCADLDGNPLAGLDLGASFTDVPGGTASWTFTSPSVNYNSDAGSVAIDITPIDATCVVTGYDVTLDYLTHTATGSCAGLGGVDLSAGLDLSGTTHSSVGLYSDAWTFTSPSINYNNATGSVTDRIHYAASGTCLGSPGHQILQPINVDGTSVFKQGSTVPAKFRVCDASGHPVGTAGVVSEFRLIMVVNGGVENVNEPVESTTPDTAFRWSPTDQQWIFNINTKSLAKGKTYVSRITLNDGSTIDIMFGLK